MQVSSIEGRPHYSEFTFGIKPQVATWVLRTPTQEYEVKKPVGDDSTDQAGCTTTLQHDWKQAYMYQEYDYITNGSNKVFHPIQLYANEEVEPSRRFWDLTANESLASLWLAQK